MVTVEWIGSESSMDRYVQKGINIQAKTKKFKQIITKICQISVHMGCQNSHVDCIQHVKSQINKNKLKLKETQLFIYCFNINFVLPLRRQTGDLINGL